MSRDALKEKLKTIATAAVFFALAIILSIIEGFIPSPNGVKLGLSNIVVMYSLFYMKKRDALAIALMKGFFVFLLKGPISGILSLSGGTLSVAVMSLLIVVSSNKVSYLLASVAGAITHNLGQFVVASSILGTPLWFYLPVLLFSGVAAGVATSVLLRLTLPALGKLGKNKNL